MLFSILSDQPSLKPCIFLLLFQLAIDSHLVPWLFCEIFCILTCQVSVIYFDIKRKYEFASEITIYYIRLHFNGLNILRFCCSTADIYRNSVKCGKGLEFATNQIYCVDQELTWEHFENRRLLFVWQYGCFKHKV